MSKIIADTASDVTESIFEIFLDCLGSYKDFYKSEGDIEPSKPEVRFGGGKVSLDSIGLS